MLTPLHRLVLPAFALALACDAGFAQPSGASPTPSASVMPTTSKEAWQRLHRVSKIIGSDVRNTRGERIGDIEDLILDRNGNVSHAVVSTGGFLGIGDRLHAVPWALIQTPPGRDFRVLDIDKNRLKNAPNFDPKNWPSVIDERWSEENNRHYRPDPTNR